MTKLASILVFASISLHAEESCFWEQAPGYFQRHIVQLKLDAGHVVEGSWRGVTPTEASFYVAKTSNNNTYPKGMQTIPRTSIRSVAYRSTGIRGKMIGLIGGYLAIAPLIFIIGVPEVAVPVFVGGLIGTTSLGHSYDRRWRAVQIIPPQDTTPPATHPRSLETPSSPAIPLSLVQ